MNWEDDHFYSLMIGLVLALGTVALVFIIMIARAVM